MTRAGNYPEPLYWPERLTGSERAFFEPLDFVFNLIETDSVTQSYVQDGYPGPCVMAYHNSHFFDWMPALTIERAEQYAGKMI